MLGVHTSKDGATSISLNRIMRSPLERLKQLPWFALFQAAGLTAIAVIVLEYCLFFLIIYVPATRPLLITLTSGFLGLITTFVAAMGVGALAVLILERLPRVVINSGSLWGLVACVAVVLLIVQSLKLLPLGLAGMDQTLLVGVLLGVFLKGQSYWKSYRRW